MMGKIYSTITIKWDRCKVIVVIEHTCNFHLILEFRKYFTQNSLVYLKCPQLRNPTAVVYHVVDKTAAVKVPRYGPLPNFASHIIPRPVMTHSEIVQKHPDCDKVGKWLKQMSCNLNQVSCDSLGESNEQIV